MVPVCPTERRLCDAETASIADFGRASRIPEGFGSECGKPNGGKALGVAAEIPEPFEISRSIREESAKCLSAKRFRGFQF